ncbi:MAG: hypothetical protein AAFU86_11260, partial [Pseudomonadota bacterium]
MAVQSSAFLQRRATGYRAFALSSTILMTIMALPVGAQQTFTGATDQNWDQATSNWNPGPTFTNNDDAIFDTVGGTVDITEAGGITAGEIDVNSGASGLIVTGNDLTINNNVTVNGAATTADIQANITGNANADGDGQ